MGSCPRCGNSGFLLKTYGCMSCGTIGCERCQIAAGQYRKPDGNATPFRTCSWECFDRWAWSHVSQGNDATPWGSAWVFQNVELVPSAAGRVKKMAEDLRRERALGHAINLINAERHEDAARIYESLGMWREAGEARRVGRRQVTTQVHVDVNNLIEHVRKGGLATTYTCPACKSPIQITNDTSASSLKTCQYCGSAIQTTDLAEFLSKVVGGR